MRWALSANVRKDGNELRTFDRLNTKKSAWEEVKEVAAEEEREVDEDDVKEYEVEEQTKRGPNQG